MPSCYIHPPAAATCVKQHQQHRDVNTSIPFTFLICSQSASPIPSALCMADGSEVGIGQCSLPPFWKENKMRHYPVICHALTAAPMNPTFRHHIPEHSELPTPVTRPQGVFKPQGQAQMPFPIRSRTEWLPDSTDMRQDWVLRADLRPVIISWEMCHSNVSNV